MKIGRKDKTYLVVLEIIQDLATEDRIIYDLKGSKI